MGLIDLASEISLWRGMDYYEDNKVSFINQVDENVSESEVIGSNNKSYHVLIDIEHPRKSRCNCPFADGRRVICKHMVATYFTIYPQEAKQIIEEVEKYEKEEEQHQQKVYKEIENYVNSLTKQELRERLVLYMIDEKESKY